MLRYPRLPLRRSGGVSSFRSLGYRCARFLVVQIQRPKLRWHGRPRGHYVWPLRWQWRRVPKPRVQQLRYFFHDSAGRWLFTFVNMVDRCQEAGARYLLRTGQTSPPPHTGCWRICDRAGGTVGVGGDEPKHHTCARITRGMAARMNACTPPRSGKTTVGNNLCSWHLGISFSIRLRLWLGLWFRSLVAFLAQIECSICSY